MPEYTVKIKEGGKTKAFKVIQPSVEDAERDALKQYPNCKVVSVSRGSEDWLRPAIRHVNHASKRD